MLLPGYYPQGCMGYALVFGTLCKVSVVQGGAVPRKGL